MHVSKGLIAYKGGTEPGSEAEGRADQAPAWSRASSSQDFKIGTMLSRLL